MIIGNPLFLWGLLAVPLPILVHLFFKRRKAKVPFSTLQFFQHHKRYLAHRRHLREILLLIVRTLALLFLVLALARVLVQHIPYALTTRSDVVIVLDDTLSMDRKLASGETAFELGVRKAEEILDRLSEGDAAALVFVSGRRGIDLTRQRARVKQLIEKSPVTAAGGGFSAALKQAANILETKINPNREIFVISDFQANQAPENPPDLKIDDCVHMYFLPILGNEENLSVQTAGFSTRPAMTGRRLTLPHTIRNHGKNDRETTVSLLVEGQLVNSVTAKVPAGESMDGRFEIVPRKAGFLTGGIAVKDRNLSLDNRCRFTLNVSENIRVLLLESDILSRVEPFYFLRNALVPDGKGTVNGIQTESGFVQEISFKQLENDHAVVLANPSPVGIEKASILYRYMLAGGTVVVFAGSRTGPDTLASFADKRLRDIFGAPLTRNFEGMTFKGSLKWLNDLLQLDLFKGRRFFSLNPSAASEILAESQGAPVLASIHIGSGQCLVFAFSCRRDMTNWPELKSYPVAMINLFIFAARDPRRNSSIECGNLLRLRVESKTMNQVRVSQRPGHSFTIPVKKDAAVFADTWRPGILTADGASPRVTALNPVVTESNLTGLKTSRLHSLVRGPIQLLKTGAALYPQLLGSRRGSDLTGLFLLLLMLMMIFDVVLGNPYFLRRLRGKPNG